MPAAQGGVTASHDDRVAAEIRNYSETADIHALPGFFHYWSQKHLGPLVERVFGTSDMQSIFSQELRSSIEASGNPNIVSVGSGDGSIEIAVSQRMIADGARNFRFECLELSPFLIERGREVVHQLRLEPHVVFREVDLTYWQPDHAYGAAFAHHSLHHIVALEHVFDKVRSGLAVGASFVISDVIGRNGHMRWPETLGLIENLWRVMPDRYKYHHLFRRQMDHYLNWDCSGESFEGIRAQDILPLLLERFSFRKMCGWGSLTDAFVDRGYGHNFNPHRREDREFIDRLWEAEIALLSIGALTPTAMIAVLSPDPGPILASFPPNPWLSVRHTF